MSQLSALCESKRLSARVTYGSRLPVPESFPRGSTAWTVTLRFQGRQMTVPFYTGPAISQDPTAADVLSCLLSDASSADNARSFEEWASDLGYDTDSRKAEATFKACQRISIKVRKLLGDDFDAFTSAEH